MILETKIIDSDGKEYIVNNNNNNGMGIKLIAAFIVTIIVSVLVGAGGLLLFFHFNPDYVSKKVTNINKQEKEVTVNENGIADAVEKVYDSIVVVETFQRNTLYATGSGVIYKSDGNTHYVITNYHVISSGTVVKVVLSDKEEITVKVVGGDKYADIAVLSFESDKDIAVAELGESATMRVGDTVFAIGAPLDSEVYSWTVTRGVLSGKDRQVEVSTNNSYFSDWIMNVLQTDAAINNGNSGGALCNSNGQVIGITNMKLADTNIEGMGFAIPIEEAKNFADTVVSGGQMTRPVLGISMQDATYTSDGKKVAGVVVAEVAEGGAAEKAGLQAGDVILSLDDTEVTSIANLRYTLYKYKVGDVVTIKYYRDGKTATTKVTLQNE